jgi:hypothetical protein
MSNKASMCPTRPSTEHSLIPRRPRSRDGTTKLKSQRSPTSRRRTTVSRSWSRSRVMSRAKSGANRLVSRVLFMAILVLSIVSRKAVVLWPFLCAGVSFVPVRSGMEDGVFFPHIAPRPRSPLPLARNASLTSNRSVHSGPWRYRMVPPPFLSGISITAASASLFIVLTPLVASNYTHVPGKLRIHHTK